MRRFHRLARAVASVRHRLIREFLGVTAYGPAARQAIVGTCLQAARTRDDLPDIINMAIEELIRQRFELPAFSTLLRIARTTRNTVNRRYQSRVCELLDAGARHRLLTILSRPFGESRSLWDQVKSEPKRSTVPQLKEFLDHVRWLQEQNVAASAFKEIPETKIRQFAAEARSLDLTSLNDMPERKRLTLAAALILKQVARALDDVAEMFVRQVKKMHNKAEEALVHYRVAHADRTDMPIAVLREITLAYKESVKFRGQSRHAAFASVLLRNAGYQRRKVSSRSPLRTWVRVCSKRCAPRGVHRICCFFTNRLLMT